MQTTSAARRCARTFLTHFFGRGLDDDRYVVQRFTVTVASAVFASAVPGVPLIAPVVLSMPSPGGRPVAP